MHVPTDDRKFPGREFGQIVSLGDTPQTWAVDGIISHKGKGRKAIFQLKWKTGDTTWEPYRIVRHLQALETYCEAQGVANVGKLKHGGEIVEGSEPEDYETNHIGLAGKYDEEYLTQDEENSPDCPLPCFSITPIVPYLQYLFTMSNTPSTVPPPTPGYSTISDGALAAILNSKNEAQKASNEMILKLLNRREQKAPKWKGKGKDRKKTSHRQRQAKAKRASKDPAAHIITNREQHGTHPHMLPLGNDWETAGLANNAPVPLSEAELIAAVESARIDQLQAQPPIPAYTPQGSTLIASEPPPHPTLNSTPNAHSHPNLANTSNVPAHSTHIRTQTTLVSNSKEELIDYEDEPMEDAGTSKATH
ncbi:hypothetical protein RhiLY_08953 [Ceratobasidium sp. AG-Ba]|nr:hypothetical protein RhiLY_08953 [Ceratobasidium sp. AG-Ba]